MLDLTVLGGSMSQRTIVHVPEEIGNKYRFAVIAGKRCEQLQKSAYPKVEVIVPVDKHGAPQDAPRLAKLDHRASPVGTDKGAT